MPCWPTWCYCSSGSRPAAAVTICPSPLTVTVCQRSGDVVQQWVTATELPISEVNRRAGFPDTGYFTRTFSNVHAMSPTRWRRAGDNVSTVRFVVLSGSSRCLGAPLASLSARLGLSSFERFGEADGDTTAVGYLVAVAACPLSNSLSLLTTGGS